MIKEKYPPKKVADKKINIPQISPIAREIFLHQWLGVSTVGAGRCWVWVVPNVLVGTRLLHS